MMKRLKKDGFDTILLTNDNELVHCYCNELPQIYNTDKNIGLLLLT